MRDTKVYRSFEEFERDELRNLERLNFSIDEMLDDMFNGELDFDEEGVRPPRRGADSDDLDS